jgi:hypothetical protein
MKSIALIAEEELIQQSRIVAKSPHNSPALFIAALELIPSTNSPGMTR